MSAIRLLLVVLLGTFFAFPAFSQTDMECGDVTVKIYGTIVKGKLVLRYLDPKGGHRRFNAVLKFPYGKKGVQEAVLSLDANPMLDNPLWESIQKCAGGPVVYDSKGKLLAGVLTVRVVDTDGRDITLSHGDVQNLAMKYPDIGFIHAIYSVSALGGGQSSLSTSRLTMGISGKQSARSMANRTQPGTSHWP